MINLLSNFKKATEEIKIDFPDITISNYFFPEKAGNPYVSSFHGIKEDLVKSSKYFIDSCGIPDFVEGDSQLVEKCLEEKGKVLKRKFNGAIMGKHVVDKK